MVLGGGESDDVEYVVALYLDGNPSLIEILPGIVYCRLYDVENNSAGVLPSGVLMHYPSNTALLAIAYNKNAIVSDYTLGSGASTITAYDFLSQDSEAKEAYDRQPRLTKEEFFKLPEAVSIEFGDEEIAKTAYELLYKYLQTGSSNYTIDLPMYPFGYESINGYNALHVYKLNMPYDSSITNDTIVGTGNVDCIYLFSSDGASNPELLDNWHQGLAKIYLDDGSVRYSWFVENVQ